jgi:hypothetical protein
MIDQEGGLVRRLGGAPEYSEKQVGASANPREGAREAGAGAAANLRSVGLNVNLAPVLDVFRRPGNFVDGYERSYSSTPTVVAALGGSFIKAQQASGVAATAKHFPGLGAAGRLQDTDQGPVTLSQPLGVIRSVDETPYRTAIAAHVRLVMLSWATYPALDPTLPSWPFAHRRRTGAPPQAWIQRSNDHRQHRRGCIASIWRPISAGDARAPRGRRSRPMLWPQCYSRQSGDWRTGTQWNSFEHPRGRSYPLKCRTRC